MAKIIKRGDEYFVQFYGNGLLFEKYAGTDKARAQELLEEITTSLPKGAMSNVVPDKDFDEFLEEYRRYATERFSLATRQRLLDAFMQFLDFFRSAYDPPYKLSKITPKTLERFRDELKQQGVEPEEVNFVLYLLRFILEFAIKQGYLNDNPTLHVRFLDSYAPALLEDDDLIAMKKKAKDKEKLVVDFLCGEIPLNEKLKSVNWNDLQNETLKASYIKRLLEQKVSLAKIHEIMRVDDIDKLKPYVALIPQTIE